MLSLSLSLSLSACRVQEYQQLQQPAAKEKGKPLATVGDYLMIRVEGRQLL
jgi:hypothetical protein